MEQYLLKITLKCGYDEYKNGDLPTGKVILHPGKVVSTQELNLCPTCYHIFTNKEVRTHNMATDIYVHTSIEKTGQGIIRGCRCSICHTKD